MADLTAPSSALSGCSALPDKKPDVKYVEIGLDNEAKEVSGENEKPAEDVELTARQLFYFWDAVSHCAEPEHYKEITEMLKQAVDEEDHQADPAAPPVQDKSAKAPASAGTKPASKVLNEFEMEFMDNKYRISWTPKGKPKKHSSWPSEFCMVVNEDDAKEPYFQVFKTELESLVIDTRDPESTSQAWAETKKNPDRLVYQFGRKYVFGPASLDENGDPRIGLYSQTYDYNYAEHAILGNRLRLKFSDSKTVVAGDRRLNLENGNSLTYGEINGLGGDFFATNNPICTGSSFDQQCQYFLDAYNLLGKAASGAKEAPSIGRINAREMEAVADAINSGKSTKQVYKDLGNSDPGTISRFTGLPVTKTDEELTKETMERDGPSYARMALLNLDHFGEDAHTAYNAGHTCAMRAAAAGNLEIGYAMNAFADHYLGDCFASGHIRTPRRKLHAPANHIEKVCGIIYDIYQDFSKGNYLLPILLGKLVYNVKDIALDACSKFMHDEDNKRGLVVVNKRGDRWIAFGDTMLFEEANARNLKYMKEALQASADEVYQAYATKQVPSDVNGFAAWRIAPSGIDKEKCHHPLFRPDGHYRTNLSEPWSSDYSDPSSWFRKGYPSLMAALSTNEYFKNL